MKKYFPLPNEIFSLKLKPAELAIYAYMMYLENRKTFTCYPSYKTIGKAVGLSVNTVQKYVKSLEEKNFIETQYTSIFRKTGEKVNGNLRYTIKPISKTLDTFYDNQMRIAELQQAQRQHKARVEG